MNKWTFYEYSGSILASWETVKSVLLTTPFGDTKLFLGEFGSSAVCLGLLFQAADSSFAYSVFALLQNSTPISPFHKGNEGFLWQLQPKSPSVYAEPNDLDAMQINSVLIWMLPEVGGGGRRMDSAQGSFCAPPTTDPRWPLVTLALCPVKNNPSFCCSFYFHLWKETLQLVNPLACLVSASFTWSLAVLSEVGRDEMERSRLREACLKVSQQRAWKIVE